MKMVLPVLAWSATVTSFLFLASPRMPFYQVTTMKPVSLPWISFPTFDVSCQVVSEVVIENDNFVGAEIHSTFADLYYPDWYGNLRHIGDLTDQPDGMWNGTDTSVQATLLPRQTASKPYNLISIRNMSPNTYLNLVQNAISSGGTIELSFSLVAHIKTLAGKNQGVMPVTIGMMCDNRLNTLRFPAQIVERNCTFEFVTPGWVDDVDLKRKHMKSKAMKRYGNSGSILHNDPRQKALTEDEEKRQLIWHEI